MYVLRIYNNRTLYIFLIKKYLLHGYLSFFFFFFFFFWVNFYKGYLLEDISDYSFDLFFLDHFWEWIPAKGQYYILF